MAMMGRPDARWTRDTGDEGSHFDIRICVSVQDAATLWRMAAATAMTSGGLTEADVEDMLGPCEDPNIADCLGLILGPGMLAGCTFEDFAVTRT